MPQSQYEPITLFPILSVSDIIICKANRSMSKKKKDDRFWNQPGQAWTYLMNAGKREN